MDNEPKSEETAVQKYYIRKKTHRYSYSMDCHWILVPMSHDKSVCMPTQFFLSIMISSRPRPQYVWYGTILMQILTFKTRNASVKWHQ